MVWIISLSLKTPTTVGDGRFLPAGGQWTLDNYKVLFEGGVNITQIFEGSTAPCFASFLAETRSSTSVSAVLKDFVLGAFPVCGVNITANCPSSRINPNETGFIYTFGQVLLPDLAYIILFLPMVIILAARPRGLFGRISA